MFISLLLSLELDNIALAKLAFGCHPVWRECFTIPGQSFEIVSFRVSSLIPLLLNCIAILTHDLISDLRIKMVVERLCRIR